jgi:hypothetical protein
VERHAFDPKSLATLPKFSCPIFFFYGAKIRKQRPCFGKSLQNLRDLVAVTNLGRLTSAPASFLAKEANDPLFRVCVLGVEVREVGL